MLIDPYKSVSKKVNIEKLASKTDKIGNRAFLGEKGFSDKKI